jgi:hypothetical protein
MTVDEFVETQILPEYRPIAQALRVLVRECAPDSQEAFSYGMPVFKLQRIFAYITASKQGITFSFVRGVHFEDPYGLLGGRGKWARNVKIKRLEDIHEEALREYIRQALDWHVK